MLQHFTKSLFWDKISAEDKYGKFNKSCLTEIMFQLNLPWSVNIEVCDLETFLSSLNYGE